MCLRVLKWGDYPGPMKSQRVLVSQRGRKDDQSEREVRREVVREERGRYAAVFEDKGSKSKGMQAASRSWKRQENHSPVDFRRNQPGQHPGFSPVKLISDF